jgi:hypothetical protein
MTTKATQDSSGQSRFGPYRNLVDGAGLGLCVFIGANIGPHCMNPLLSYFGPKSAYSLLVTITVAGYVLGMIAGGVAWKLCKWICKQWSTRWT